MRSYAPLWLLAVVSFGCHSMDKCNFSRDSTPCESSCEHSCPSSCSGPSTSCTELPLGLLDAGGVVANLRRSPAPAPGGVPCAGNDPRRRRRPKRSSSTPRRRPQAFLAPQVAYAQGDGAGRAGRHHPRWPRPPHADGRDRLQRGRPRLADSKRSRPTAPRLAAPASYTIRLPVPIVAILPPCRRRRKSPCPSSRRLCSRRPCRSRPSRSSKLRRSPFRPRPPRRNSSRSRPKRRWSPCRRRPPRSSWRPCRRRRKWSRSRPRWFPCKLRLKWSRCSLRSPSRRSRPRCRWSRSRPRRKWSRFSPRPPWRKWSRFNPRRCRCVRRVRPVRSVRPRARSRSGNWTEYGRQVEAA